MNRSGNKFDPALFAYYITLLVEVNYDGKIPYEEYFTRATVNLQNQWLGRETEFIEQAIQWEREHEEVESEEQEEFEEIDDLEGDDFGGDDLDFEF